MIGVARGVSVFAYAEPCDMRKNFDTLSAITSKECPAAGRRSGRAKRAEPTRKSQSL